jgi:hypothetical protein
MIPLEIFAVPAWNPSKTSQAISANPATTECQRQGFRDYKPEAIVATIEAKK